MAFECLKVERRSDVLWVQIDRPESRNALSRATLAELRDAFASHASDASLKAAVVTGAGNEAFAAGGDVKEFARIRTPQETGELFDLATDALDRIRDFPLPVVAAVNGWALGGGAELSLACDYRVAAAHAVFGFIQARLGITTGFGGGTDLMGKLTPSQAMLMGLKAQTLQASQALQAGLFDAVAEEGESLEQAVDKFLAPILRQRPQVIRGYKAMAIAARRGLPMQQRRSHERDAFIETWVHEDHWSAVEASSKKQARSS